MQDGDGTAVCAEVCRPSCRWAKARRQKIGAGERGGRRKKGQGADERRQLRRQLDEAEARVEELEGTAVEDVDGQLRAAKEREEQAAVREWRKEAKEKGMRVRAERAVAELERERQWAAEVVAVRRAMRKAGQMEVLSKELREEKEHRRVLEERVRKLEEGGGKRGREAEREAEEGWLRRRRASERLVADHTRGRLVGGRDSCRRFRPRYTGSGPNWCRIS